MLFFGWLRPWSTSPLPHTRHFPISTGTHPLFGNTWKILATVFTLQSRQDSFAPKRKNHIMEQNGNVYWPPFLFRAAFNSKSQAGMQWGRCQKVCGQYMMQL